MSDKQIAVVIGANKGIGREIAKRLADLGNAVVVGARNQEAGEQVVAEIRASGGEAVAVALDVTDSASAAAAAKRSRACSGGSTHWSTMPVSATGRVRTSPVSYLARPTSTTSDSCSRPTYSASSM